MTVRTKLTPAVAGVLIGVGLLALTAEIVAIAVGALVTAVMVRTRPTDRDYTFSGTLFLAGIGLTDALLPFAGRLSPVATVTLVVVGGLGLLFVAVRSGVRYAIRRAGRHADRDALADVWEFGATAGSLAYVVLNAAYLVERVLRTVLLAVGTPSSFTANLLFAGSETNVGQWLGAFSLVVFVLSVLVGFHTLGTWNRASRLRRNPTVRAAGERSKRTVGAVGRSLGSRQQSGTRGDVAAGTVSDERSD